MQPQYNNYSAVMCLWLLLTFALVAAGVSCIRSGLKLARLNHALSNSGITQMGKFKTIQANKGHLKTGGAAISQSREDVDAGARIVKPEVQRIALAIGAEMTVAAQPESYVKARRLLIRDYGYVLEYFVELTDHEARALEVVLMDMLERGPEKYNKEYDNQGYKRDINNSQYALVSSANLDQAMSVMGGRIDEIAELLSLKKQMALVGSRSLLSNEMEFYGVPLSSTTRLALARVLRNKEAENSSDNQVLDEGAKRLPYTYEPTDPATGLKPFISELMTEAGHLLSQRQLQVLKRFNDQVIQLTGT